MPTHVKSLSPDKLRLLCDPAGLAFETTAEVAPATTIIGQPRATRALEFGMGLKSKGYNIFVMGSSGTGRSMAIRHFLRERCGNEPTPPDWVYVHNFDATHRPRAMSLAPGQGALLAERMKQLIDNVQLSMTQALESQSYRRAVQALDQKVAEQREEKLDALERKATEQGFDLQETASGLVVTAADEDSGETADGSAATGDANGGATSSVHATDSARRDAQRALQVELQDILRELRHLERDARDERQKLDRDVVDTATQDEFDTIRAQYEDQPPVVAYLNAVRDDLLDQISRAAPGFDEKELDNLIDLRRYEVNVLVDNSADEGAPVIVQLNPTHENLFGLLEYEPQGHSIATHYTQIKAGDLHRANGGYLVMYALHLVRQRETWDALKRALKAEEIEMRPPQSDGPVIANSLWPEPVPLRVKVILLGSAGQYYSLFENDEEFRDLFKVRADFSDTMPRDAANEQAYAQFVAARSQEERLRPFGRAAVAKIVEHGARLAEHQCKLSTRFGAVADLVREADYWAGTNGHETVTAEDVQQSLDERAHRANLAAEQLREEILEGLLFIATEDEVVGQVNGLSVLEIGEFSFGHPSRITARTFMGDDGVIHIERETDMSLPDHDKGVLTLNAYLGGTYAQHQPLSLNASLTFEQIYVYVDGDSASSSELYALLSSLSLIPIRQGISVTGSVNQRGEIQPIGSVNEKIEGFFDICCARGLTGEQGVIIPATNVVNLMLREDVVQAARDGRFHVWAVSHINEGLELLTGRPAGVPNADGDYPEGTVHNAVKKRLLELATELKSFGEDHNEDRE
jgi:predicted ATP-dependent protease